MNTPGKSFVQRGWEDAEANIIAGSGKSEEQSYFYMVFILDFQKLEKFQNPWPISRIAAIKSCDSTCWEEETQYEENKCHLNGNKPFDIMHLLFP